MVEWNLAMLKKLYPFLAEYLISVSTTKDMDVYNLNVELEMQYHKLGWRHYYSYSFKEVLSVFYNMFML